MESPSNGPRCLGANLRVRLLAELLELIKQFLVEQWAPEANLETALRKIQTIVLTYRRVGITVSPTGQKSAREYPGPPILPLLAFHS
jgi:hypothetical protein